MLGQGYCNTCICVFRCVYTRLQRHICSRKRAEIDNKTTRSASTKSSRYHLSSDYDDSISVYVIMQNGTQFWGGVHSKGTEQNNTVSHVYAQSMLRMTNSLANCRHIVYKQYIVTLLQKDSSRIRRTGLPRLFFRCGGFSSRGRPFLRKQHEYT